jgi:hypothetical protein
MAKNNVVCKKCECEVFYMYNDKDGKNVTICNWCWARADGCVCISENPGPAKRVDKCKPGSGGK